jgi:putative phosphoribosyl transferase
LEVARALHAPLDLLLVRKIGAPGQPELAVGAVAWVPASAPGPRPVEAPEPSAVPATPASPAGPAPAQNERPVVAVLDAGLMAATGADQAYVERAVVREGAELRRRQQRYLQGRAPVSLHGRTAIVVDDGLATGATVHAALKALRAGTAGQAPQAVVLAVPVAPAEVLASLAAEVDVTVCLWTPEPFIAVGAHYRAFPQVSDEEVVAALNRAAGAAPVPQA